MSMISESLLLYLWAEVPKRDLYADTLDPLEARETAKGLLLAGTTC